MKSDIKICIIGPSTDTNYVGGVATHIKTLKSLSCFRDAVVLDPGSANSNSRVSIFQIVKNIVALKGKIIAGDFSFVLVNSSIYPSAFIKFLLILFVLPMEQKRKIYVFFHGGRFPVLNHSICKILNIFIRPLMAKVNRFHFLSRVQQEGFQRIFSNCEAGLYANYSTADTICERKKEPANALLRLLFVGRVIREKGVFELISAIEKISNENLKVSLTIAGDGPDLMELIKRSERLPVGTVEFMGFVTGVNLEDAYQKADLLLLPSYQEGFPYVVIEAMRAGLPIISTNSGALETLVQDGVTGFKVKTRDVDSIVKAISKMSGNRGLLGQMSQNCQRYFLDNLSRSAAEEYYAEFI